MDAVLIGGSELGYGLVPFLRTFHPKLALVDLLHEEDVTKENNGFAVLSIELRSQLDLTLTPYSHLKEWMISQGAPPDQVAVLPADVDGIGAILATAFTAAGAREIPANDSHLHVIPHQWLLKSSDYGASKPKLSIIRNLRFRPSDPGQLETPPNC